MARPSAARAGKVRAAAQRDTILRTLTGSGVPDTVAKRVVAAGLGQEFASSQQTLAGSASVFKPTTVVNPKTDRGTLAQPWQREAYRHINICGEARYAATLFAAVAGRADIGVSEPQARARKAVWVDSGIEVDAFAEIAATVRERTALIRSFMLHWQIAGECYLIARERVDTDPPSIYPMVWEIVSVLDLRRVGATWQVRHDNNEFIDLHPSDPVIRMWNPDPANRREAWSPFRSLLPTLREIEWLTRHIFTQVRSRLLGAGVWFLPENLTFAPPPPDAVEGGAEAIAAMNEAEQFMASLAVSGMEQLDSDEVGFPSVVMAAPDALERIDQSKLIQFWSEIDKAAMELRSDAVRRFALGADMPPEQILGSSGLAVTGAGGSAGSVNHWGVWANEEQTISAHVEPALDELCGHLTVILRLVVPNSDKVIAYDASGLRMKQDRSEIALQMYDRGELKAEVALREMGFDPDHDTMDSKEFTRWVLKKIVSGNPSPEMVNMAAQLLDVPLPDAPALPNGTSGGTPPGAEAPNTDAVPYQGPPREQHDHSPAPYALARTPYSPNNEAYMARVAQAEGLVLRALEKAGNRLINQGKRGRDRPDTPISPVAAHVEAGLWDGSDVNFDFSTASLVFNDMDPRQVGQLTRQLGKFCAHLYRTGAPYSRKSMINTVKGL